MNEARLRSLSRAVSIAWWFWLVSFVVFFVRWLGGHGLMGLWLLFGFTGSVLVVVDAMLRRRLAETGTEDGASATERR